jgi:uncharacterized protein YndB with AHSA1/START domain
MATDLIAKRSVRINADKQKVWDALINPRMIKEYLFGTKTISDWKVGGKITFKGIWEGKEYVDGGTILKMVPEKIFQYTYWSSMSGTPDSPENYSTVTYELSKKENGTELSVSQDNCKTIEHKEHCEKNWEMVLNSMKKLLEGKSQSKA